MSDASDHPASADSPRIVVVGPCASGKSTLVANLQRAGLDAWVAGQEHSAVRALGRDEIRISSSPSISIWNTFAPGAARPGRPVSTPSSTNASAMPSPTPTSPSTPA